jgi:pantoate--beta-alanine ligase
MALSVTASPRAVRARIRAWRARGETVAFVPTMGALHEGHLELARRAKRSADRVVASVFVNPLQFNDARDLKAYPRDLAGDRAMLAHEGVELVFAPRAAAFYPQGHATRVTVGGLDQVLEGAHRPGHFTGVATVVTKLLNVVEPDQLWLGQKDAQQVAELSRMVADLDFAVTVRVAPTVRARDGLALSSRNARLTPAERAQAPALYRALLAGARHKSAGAAERAMRRELAQARLARVDYATLVDPSTFLKPAPGAKRGLLVIAARFPSARLIDNLPCDLKPSPERGGRRTGVPRAPRGAKRTARTRQSPSR